MTTPLTRLEFRRPTSREQDVRAQVAAEVEAKGSWGQWTRLPPSPGSQLRPPWGPDDPLRLNWILKDLYFGHDRLPTVPLDRLDVLGGVFAAEREALRAELLAVRDDTAAFERQVQKVKRDYPGLAAWMEACAGCDGGHHVAAAPVVVAPRDGAASAADGRLSPVTAPEPSRADGGTAAVRRRPPKREPTPSPTPPSEGSHWRCGRTYCDDSGRCFSPSPPNCRSR